VDTSLGECDSLDENHVGDTILSTRRRSAMPDVKRGEVTIYYEDEGQGSPVLLIHGHTLDRRVWEPVMPDLRAAGLRVVRPDLRGHGRSDRPDSGYHWFHHSEDMGAVLDAAGVDRASVVGFSIGGGVAIESALSMAQRVSSLLLIAPVMPDRPFEPLFLDNLKQVARVARSEGILAAMEGPWAASPLFAASFRKPGVREKATEIVRDFPGAEYLATERDQVERPVSAPERLHEISVQTRVMVGEHEMQGFRDFAAEAATGIPNCRLEIVDDCGHLIPLEEPALVARRIIESATE
jgi:pimeloyl-ACP methyl ester carboxylesterase